MKRSSEIKELISSSDVISSTDARLRRKPGYADEAPVELWSVVGCSFFGLLIFRIILKLRLSRSINRCSHLRLFVSYILT